MLIITKIWMKFNVLHKVALALSAFLSYMVFINLPIWIYLELMLDLLITALNQINNILFQWWELAVKITSNLIFAILFIVFLICLLIGLTVFILTRKSDYKPRRIADLYNKLSKNKWKVMFFNAWFILFWLFLAIIISMFNNFMDVSHTTIILLVLAFINFFNNFLFLFR